MKLKLFALLMLLATVGLWSFWCAPVLCAEYYKVYLQRIDQDLYKDLNSGMRVQTRFCYEYVYGEEALLKDAGPYERKLIFRNDQTCEIVKMF